MPKKVMNGSHCAKPLMSFLVSCELLNFFHLFAILGKILQTIAVVEDVEDEGDDEEQEQTPPSKKAKLRESTPKTSPSPLGKAVSSLQKRFSSRINEAAGMFFHINM